jgi:hypothetical protein
MSSNRLVGPTPRDSQDWKAAWDAVAHLAATRERAQPQQGDSRTAPHLTEPRPATGADVEHGTAQPAIADEYARALAEIEQASAALRKAEPTLETWQPDAAASGEPRTLRSVWILVGCIWLSTITVFAGAIGAIVYFLG